eukprot:785206-Prymnesium_polylepis.1
MGQASRHSAIHGFGARRKVLHSRTIAAALCGDVRVTTGLCEVGVAYGLWCAVRRYRALRGSAVGVRRMKVLRETLSPL